MSPQTGTPEHYAEEIGVLWTGLTRTLGRLDRIAADPDRLGDAHVESSLRRLQYSLHLASEHAYGVEPPVGAESAHAELADALACARDATAEVADTVADWGADGVLPVLHQWRGALFRVRLARLRLAIPAVKRPEAEPPVEPGIARPLIAFALALAGALAVVAGATIGEWPIWSLGLLAVGGSALPYRL